MITFGLTIRNNLVYVWADDKVQGFPIENFMRAGGGGWFYVRTANWMALPHAWFPGLDQDSNMMLRSYAIRGVTVLYALYTQ